MKGSEGKKLRRVDPGPCGGRQTFWQLDFIS